MPDRLVSARIPDDIHRKCRQRQIDDGKTFQGIILAALESYAAGKKGTTPAAPAPKEERKGWKP